MKTKACKPGRTISFKTRRGRKISFKQTCRGHRTNAWNRKFGAAGKSCARSHKPGTKSMGKCVANKLK